MALYFRSLLVALACLFALPAVAAITPVYQSCESAKPAHVPAAGTMVGGCGGYGPYETPLVIKAEAGSASSCVAGPVCNQVGFQLSYSWTRSASCPANSTSDGAGGCVCAAGYAEVNGQCKQPKEGPCGPLQDKPLGVPLNLSYGNRSVASLARMVGRETRSCFGGGQGTQGCAITGTVQGCWGAGAGGAAGCRVTGAAFTGDSCQPDPEPSDCPPGTEPSAYVPGVCIPKENNCPPGSSPSKYASGVCIPDENPCPPGYSPSKYVQGVCVPNEHPDADGNGEEGKPNKCPPGYVPSKYVKDICIPADKTSGSDGDTTCEGDMCTITNPDGSTEEKPRDTFCAENPESPMCVKGTFGGSCGSGFSCEGDAIQCAIAKEQHQQNCKIFGEDKDLNSLTNKALNGNDDNSADNLRANAQQVHVGMLDDGGFGWSRACPPDPSFDVPGGSFSIPFSKVCTPLEVLSLAAVGLTLLSSLLFVIGKKD